MLHFPLWKKTLIGAICLLGLLYAAPNFLPAGMLPAQSGWLPGQRVNLGLDLQGGAHLLFRVEANEVVTERMETVVREVRLALRKARLTYTGLGVKDGKAVFALRDPSKSEQVRGLIREIDQRLVIEAGAGGQFALALPEEALKQEIDQLVGQSIEVIRRRIDEDGTKEPLIQRQGLDRILVQVPGAEDTESVKNKVGRTAKMTFHLVDGRNSVAEAQNGRVPPGSMLIPSAEKQPDGTPQRMYLVEREVRVGGEHLTNAQPALDQNNRPAVGFQFDTVGGRKFGEVTTQNVGRLLAIVLDGEVISAPEVRQPIIGGNGIITGRFSVTESNELALLLRAGALPAPLIILEERSVGPGLGQDSIDAGALASVIGLVLVILFMAGAYGLFGLMADIALLFNIALIIALLSALQATLTLPGIAGIVLTVGMAVDANVLIFERIREEGRNGRTTVNAIESGYRRALTTIIDSNLTTLIAAALLYAFGSGPVKGFAVTLSIGIITSMFTSIMVTRWFVTMWVRHKRPKALPI